MKIGLRHIGLVPLLGIFSSVAIASESKTLNFSHLYEGEKQALINSTLYESDEVKSVQFVYVNIDDFQTDTSTIHLQIDPQTKIRVQKVQAFEKNGKLYWSGVIGSGERFNLVKHSEHLLGSFEYNNKQYEINFDQAHNEHRIVEIKTYHDNKPKLNTSKSPAVKRVAKNNQPIISHYEAVTSHASNTDKDRDYIDDGYEDALIKKFAPLLYLHPNETSLPTSVDKLLPRVQMKHNSDNFCSDKVPLNWGQATSNNLSNQVVSGQGGLFCKNSSSRYYSSKWYPEDKRFYLRVAEAVYPGNLPAAKCYAKVEVSPSSNNNIKYEIEYWFLYAYNPAIPGALGIEGGQHQGDWEHIKLLITPQEKIYRLSYASHGDPTNYSPSHSDITLIGGTHPEVYSARRSHASYPKAGTFPRTFGFNDYTAKSSKKIDCTNRSVNVGNSAFPINGNKWVKYRGAWGTKKRISSPTEDSGPIGPEMKGIDWNTQFTVSGDKYFTFQKTDTAAKVKTYTLNINSVASKLGTSKLVGASISPYLPITRQGNQVKVTFRNQTESAFIDYQLRLVYSAPSLGGTNKNHTKTVPVRVRFIGGAHQCKIEGCI